LIAIFLAEVFIFLNTGPLNAIIANVSRSEVRATAYAVNIFIIHALGDAISPAIVGMVSDRLGFPRVLDRPRRPGSRGAVLLLGYAELCGRPRAHGSKSRVKRAGSWQAAAGRGRPDRRTLFPARCPLPAYPFTARARPSRTQRALRAGDGLRAFREGQGPVDHRAEAARREVLDDRQHVGLRPEESAEDRHRFREEVADVHAALVAGARPAGHEASSRRDVGDELLPGGAADMLKDHIRPPLAREPPDFLREILARVVDSLVRSNALALASFSSVPATAITRAPKSFAIWTAAVPTPLPTPITRTSSPAARRA